MAMWAGGGGGAPKKYHDSGIEKYKKTRTNSSVRTKSNGYTDSAWNPQPAKKKYVAPKSSYVAPKKSSYVAPKKSSYVAPKPKPAPKPQYKSVPTYEPIYKDTYKNVYEPAYRKIAIPNARSDVSYQKDSAHLSDALAKFRNKEIASRDKYDIGVGDKLHTMGYRGGAFSSDGEELNSGMLSKEEFGKLDLERQINHSKGATGKALTPDNLGGEFSKERDTGNYSNDWIANEGDFAGRGSYWSGARLSEEDAVNQAYQERLSGLLRGRQDFRGDSFAGIREQGTETSKAQTAALSEAVSRIAGKLGIDTGLVPDRKGAGNSSYNKRIADTVRKEKTGREQVGRKQTGTKQVRI